MIDFSAYLGPGHLLAPTPTDTDDQRAALAWRRINDKKTSIVFKTPAGTTIAAQDVRLEWGDMVQESTSAAGAASVRPLIIFGVKDHPTVSATQIKEGYRFIYLNAEYRVTDVIYSIGEVQATAEAV